MNKLEKKNDNTKYLALLHSDKKYEKRFDVIRYPIC